MENINSSVGNVKYLTSIKYKKLYQDFNTHYVINLFIIDL